MLVVRQIHNMNRTKREKKKAKKENIIYGWLLVAITISIMFMAIRAIPA